MNHLCCSFRNATEILTGNWVWNDDWPGLSMANLPAAQHWMHPDKVHHHAKSGLQAFKPKILWINGQRCFLKRCKKSYYKTSHQPAKTQNTSPKVTFSKIHRSTKAIKLRTRWCYKIYTTKLVMFSTCNKLQRWSSGFGQHTSPEHPDKSRGLSTEHRLHCPGHVWGPPLQSSSQGTAGLNLSPCHWTPVSD